MPLFTSRKQDKKVKVKFAKGLLFIEQDGGKQQAFPLDWYPALRDATEEEREDWTQTATGVRFNKLGVEVNI